MVKRLDVPFPILSDSDLKLTKLLNLPTFEVEGKVLLKRLTIIIKDGIIVKVFYPVFPPNLNAEEVLEWIRLRVQKNQSARDASSW
jgi:peroxiredoxin